MKATATIPLLLIWLMNSVSLGHAQPSRATGPTRLPQGTVVHRDIDYVPDGHARQKLDLFLPNEGTNLPLIINIHGGAFKMGSKEQDMPLEYLTQGYAVASINYRLSQHAQFPAQIEDCKAAVRWLRAHAAEYRLDPNRVAAWGASAGGHLATMLGTTGDTKEFDLGPNLDQSSRVQAVVDHFGPTDFLQMDAHRLPEGMLHDPADSPESLLIGGPIQENKEKTARANPITYITSGDPPVLICHGDSDPLVPHHQSILLDAALRKAGVPVTFYTVRGGGHGGFTDPKVASMTREFLRTHLQPEKPQSVDAFEQNRRLGRGVNIVGYDPIWTHREQARFQERYFPMLKRAGFHSVRINLHPFRQMDSTRNWTLAPAWLETLDWAVQRAGAEGLMTILDCHEFGAMGDDPVSNKAKFLAFWKQVASHFKEASDQVVFEILNEPSRKLTPELWNAYLAEALAIIRESNPHRTVIVGPGFWNSIDHLEELELPENDPALIVTVHYYQPMSFTHQGAAWSSEKDKTGILWEGTTGQREKIRDDFAKVATWAKTHHRPVFLGEFGAYDRAPMESRARYTDCVARTAEANGWSWAYWQFDSDFILYDLGQDQWVEPILRALIPPISAGQPFADLVHKAGPPTIPGLVQCALYDLGGEGVAYHDSDAINNGSGKLNLEPGHQRAHASAYVWQFRKNEGVDLSFVKDWADLNHTNLVSPHLNQLYIGWTEDGEWCNYTVHVSHPGTYRVRCLYAYQANTVRFDVNGQPAGTCQLPAATASYHHWNLADIGTVRFPTAGSNVLTFHYGKGNNFAFFEFEEESMNTTSRKLGE